MNDSLNITIPELKELLDTLNEVSTFAGVKEWDKRVETEIERLQSIIRGLDIEIARDSEALEKIKYEQSKKVLGRLFGSSSETKELSVRLEERRQNKLEITKAIEHLQDFIDFTPKSSEEKEALLAELRKHKRELQEKKREITQVVRGPRMAKPKIEPTSTVFDAATLARRKAHYEREAELLPGETTATSLTRQIAQTDQTIAHVEKFA